MKRLLGAAVSKDIGTKQMYLLPGGQKLASRKSVDDGLIGNNLIHRFF